MKEGLVSSLLHKRTAPCQQHTLLVRSRNSHVTPLRCRGSDHGDIRLQKRGYFVSPIPQRPHPYDPYTSSTAWASALLQTRPVSASSPFPCLRFFFFSPQDSKLRFQTRPAVARPNYVCTMTANQIPFHLPHPFLLKTLPC